MIVYFRNLIFLISLYWTEVKNMIASICPYKVCSTDGSDTDFLDTTVTLPQSSEMFLFATVLHAIHLK